MARDFYGNALSPAQLDKLYALRRALTAPAAAESLRKHNESRERIRVRNSRLRSHNLRRHLIASGVLKPVEV